jgi:transposase, IS30 family
MAHLTMEQRYTISVLQGENYPQNLIAERIGKHPSVVSRELKRNRDLRNNEYKPDLAQRKYELRISQKPKRITFTVSIQEYVDSKLRQEYSPEQIVGVSKLENIECVSVERIYEYVWEDKKSGGTLHTHLRNKGRKYRKRGASKDKRGIITDRVDIDQRPKIVEERSRFGDLELDTIVGKDHIGGLLSINDRMTGLIKISKISAKDALQVEQKTVEILMPWKPLLHTLTSDNGKEFANHVVIKNALEVDFFFAKPHHPWERGSNENGNRLIRQYFPKGTDFTLISDQQVAEVEKTLNNRPRKRYGFLSPIQVFNNLTFDQSVAFVT